jgi:hypothetical protein
LGLGGAATNPGDFVEKIISKPARTGRKKHDQERSSTLKEISRQKAPGCGKTVAKTG